MAIEFEMKQGESGKVMNVVLSDASGPVDLSGWASVTLTARQGDGDPVLDAEPCTITDEANGVVTFEFDETTADIDPGEYDMEFKAIDAAGDVHFFPDGEFGTLTVNRSLQSA